MVCYHKNILEIKEYLMAGSLPRYSDPVLPNHRDIELAAQSGQKLAALFAKKKINEPVTIHIANGDKIILPFDAIKFLIELLSQMASGNAVTLIPIHKSLTTQEAADLLNVSRPYLIKLLEKGEIPFEKVGSHRRIKAEDFFKYQSYIAEDKKSALDELTQQAQDLDMEY
jgi:excisionase family DNA binding protein